MMSWGMFIDILCKCLFCIGTTLVVSLTAIAVFFVLIIAVIIVCNLFKAFNKK